MSLLPEYKKSPEEIAALRGKLGIPTVGNDDAGAPPSGAAAKLDATGPEVPVPLVTAAPVEVDPASGLPLHRHSEQELADLRRRGMFETQNEALRLPVRRARGVWVICGYLLAASAAVPVYRDIPMVLPVVIAAAALGFAAFLFFLRPYSRHHGAFISVVVLFVLIYAALHYFPQLRHAT